MATAGDYTGSQTITAMHKAWETVDCENQYDDHLTQRLRVPGGWLYRTIIRDHDQPPTVAMQFVACTGSFQ